MNVRMKVAFWCYFFSVLLLASFGFVYLVRAEFMPYHSVAVGLSWSAIPPQFQVLILALMKAVGGTCVALALLNFIVLIVPFRQGENWTFWALPLCALAQIAALVYAMSHVALNTAAKPPFWSSAIGAILVIIAFILSLSGQKDRTKA